MRSVVVDTSVWRHFFAGRASARALGPLLDEEGIVLGHPLVVGELVLGGLSAQQERLLQRLPQTERLACDEMLTFIRRRRLARKGIGWVDAELLASSLTSGARLWSLDAALARVARELRAAFDPQEILSQ